MGDNMEKFNEIRNSLIFYACTNELKNKIIDEENNYSVADHLFGSMILATAIDSEFKEADNLAKIYRMLFLYDFSIIYPNYDFNILKLRKQYTEEISEARNMNSKNGNLVFKYKLLDQLLTKLIKEKSTKISQEELIKEGSTIISSICSKKPQECEEIFKFYCLNFKLKDKKRTGWDSKHWNIKSDRIETVSEHVIGTIGLLIALNSEFEYKFDTDKELTMAVIHETGETIIDDITPFDGITPEEKKELEHQAMKDALGNLKEKDKLLNLLFEFDEHETPEAKCTRYGDKIEADLQSKIYQSKEMHHSLDDQENNVVFKSSKVQQMVKDGAKDAFDIWYEWDKTIYAGDEQFPEFENILKVARDNNLINLNNVIRERINLTDEEHSFLSEEITKNIKNLYKDDNISSAYLINYRGDEDSKGSLNIVVLLGSSSNYDDYENMREKLDKLNSKITRNNKTDVTISFHCDREDEYNIIAMHSDEVHRNEQLAESKILFDKSGYISTIRKSAKKYQHLFNFNLVNYIPPVDETISLKLTKTN